ncbi:carbonic anhydrase [Bisporella sp. PMI_857]|nr:carbonic anhydrase [Bisporella sp. PMI_857]
MSGKYNVLPVPRDFVASNKGTKQQILWVGCSDSLILETETLGVHPEEIFVHRNLGNVLSNGDLSSRSAIEWSLEMLKVEHIVVCGHYDCAMIREKAGNQWVRDISELHAIDERLLRKEGMTDERMIEHRLEEMFVLAEVKWLEEQPNVKKAIKEDGLKIHSFVYDKDTNQCVRLIEEIGGPGK